MPETIENYLPKKELHRVDEVAGYFGVTEQTIRNWIAHGHFGKVLKTPGGYRITRNAILHCKFKYMVVNSPN